ncbi:MAG: hypothetical protein FWD54_07430 [Endomicrobia bacterium]|nr:hypothetical protein [Endomicrobiia bacterium]MCL2800082.1 hypothetical protein [Endomicrobiia bacterium]
MFKKLVFAVMFVVVAVSLSFAEFGVIGRWGQILGTTEFDFNSVAVPGNRSEADAGVWGIDVFLGKEGMFGLAENVSFGVRLGYSQFGKNHLVDPDAELTSKIFATTENLYIKFQLHEKFAIAGSAGVFTAFNTFEYTDISTGQKKTDVSWQVLPNVSGSAEFRPIDFLAVGFEIGYMFNGKFNYADFSVAHTEIYRDISGFNYNFFVKLYLA